MQRLAAALNRRQDDLAAAAIVFLMLTGARRGETLSARWRDFDPAAGVWSKPSANTKQKKLHRVPLSASARAVLVQLAERFAPPIRRRTAMCSAGPPWFAGCAPLGWRCVTKLRLPGPEIARFAPQLRQRARLQPVCPCRSSARCSATARRPSRRDMRIFSMARCVKRPSRSAAYGKASTKTTRRGARQGRVDGDRAR